MGNGSFLSLVMASVKALKNFAFSPAGSARHAVLYPNTTMSELYLRMLEYERLTKNRLLNGMSDGRISSA